MSLHLNLSVVYPHYSRNNISYTAAELINGHQNTTADFTEAMRDMVLIRPNCNAHRHISLFYNEPAYLLQGFAHPKYCTRTCLFNNIQCILQLS